MNREEFKAIFNSKAKPLLNEFHQRATDAMGNRAVFWLVIALAVCGAIGIARAVL